MALFAARFLATALTFPDVDGDLAWQRWLGRLIWATDRLPRTIGEETFTAPGAAWVPHEWLFALVASVSTGGAWFILAGAAAAAAVGALALGCRRATSGAAAPLPIAATLTCAGIALFEAFGVRVQVFAWPLLALFVLLLEINGAIAYAAIAVAIVWANLHASVMLAPPLALAVAIGCLADEGWSPRTRRTLGIALGATIATCCTPLGAALPRYAFAVVGGPFKTIIAEWKHPDLGDASFALGALPLLLALCLFGVARWRERLVVLLMAALAFSAARNVPLFAIVCFPIVARSLSARALAASILRRETARLPRTRTERWLERCVPLGSVAAGALLAAALTARAHAAGVPTNQLVAALDAVRRLPGSHRIFCADYSWCSRFIGEPHERIFLDGRADPYPQAIWDDFSTIVGVRPGWDTVLHDRDANVLVVSRHSPLEAALEPSGDWRPVFRNALYSVWGAPRLISHRASNAHHS